MEIVQQRWLIKNRVGKMLTIIRGQRFRAMERGGLMVDGVVNGLTEEGIITHVFGNRVFLPFNRLKEISVRDEFGNEHSLEGDK